MRTRARWGNRYTCKISRCSHAVPSLTCAVLNNERTFMLAIGNLPLGIALEKHQNYDQKPVQC